MWIIITPIQKIGYECALYFPKDPEKEKETHGEIEIVCKSMEKTSNFIVKRELQITHFGEKETSKTITHYHFTGW